ncbi:MAG: hypothetical protein ACRC78_07760 [Planktothrix sp.]
MAQTTEKALVAELNIIKRELQDSFAKNDVNASGALSNSLEVKVQTLSNKINGQLLAFSYIDTVDTGRAPNQTNSGGLLDGIKNWLLYGKYGLPNTEMVASAISRSIARKGSYLFRNKIDRKIVTSIVSDDRIDKIITRLSSEFEAEVINNLKKAV